MLQIYVVFVNFAEICKTSELFWLHPKVMRVSEEGRQNKFMPTTHALISISRKMLFITSLYLSPLVACLWLQHSQELQELYQKHVLLAPYILILLTNPICPLVFVTDILNFSVLAQQPFCKERSS